MITTELAPVTAEVTVPVDPATAFRLYVSRPGRQHPAEGQSGRPHRIVYEPLDGGDWYELDAEGRRYPWGRVLTWDPPHRLVLSWMVGAQDGPWSYDPDPDHASRAEITFTGTDGGTLVRVVHTGFQAHAGGDSIRRGVHGPTGWPDDLADLARAAALVDSTPAQLLGTQTNLFCDDVERCVALFTALGLREAFRYPADGPAEHVEVDLDGARIGLTSATTANRIADLGVTTEAASSTEVVLWCSDADVLFARALAAGATGIHPPVDSPDRRLRYGWIRDHDGHQLKLVQALR